MVDYYVFLGISRDASPKEVRSAFRKLAKQFHPDFASEDPHKKRKAEYLMHRLLEAYKTLSDLETRRGYDRLLARNRSKDEGFDFRKFLLGRLSDPLSRARLIVFDLLHNLEDEALQIYEKGCLDPDFSLERILPRAEAMDLEYCLACEYEKRKKPMPAFALYKKLIGMEAEHPTFGYYFAVVVESFAKLVLDTFDLDYDFEESISKLGEASECAIPNRDRARFCLRRAEIFLKRGCNQQAAEALLLAKALHPALSGIKRLEAKQVAH